MRRTRTTLAIALTGALALLGACETAPERDMTRHSEPGVTGAAVYGPGEAGEIASSRRDEALGVREAEAVDAVASSWVEPTPPSLDDERIGRTTVSPERFIFVSDRPGFYRRGSTYRDRGIPNRRDVYRRY